MPAEDMSTPLAETATELGGDFSKDLLISKPIKQQEFDDSSTTTGFSSLPEPNGEKDVCRACKMPSYHGPYFKVHNNA